MVASQDDAIEIQFGRFAAQTVYRLKGWTKMHTQIYASK